MPAPPSAEPFEAVISGQAYQDVAKIVADEEIEERAAGQVLDA
jgi:hypothetical protein